MKGQIERDKLAWLHISQNKLAFTLVEALIAASIIGFIGIGLLVSSARKEYFYERTMARIDLQSNARTLLGWIAQDVRQTSSWDIANNNPSPTHVKFRKVIGINTITGGYNYENDYIQYDYSSTNKKVTRSEVDAGGNVLSTLDFGVNIGGIAIEMFSFSTINTSSGAVVPLDKDNLFLSKRLITTIEVKKTIAGSSTEVSVTSNREAKIRND